MRRDGAALAYVSGVGVLACGGVQRNYEVMFD